MVKCVKHLRYPKMSSYDRKFLPLARSLYLNLITFDKEFSKKSPDNAIATKDYLKTSLVSGNRTRRSTGLSNRLFETDSIPSLYSARQPVIVGVIALSEQKR